MTARDAETWGTTAGVRRGEMAALERQAFPSCPNAECGPIHKWHGLACRSGSCKCETSWTDEKESA